jgi:hypothetical protein
MPTEELENSDFLTAAFLKNRILLGCSDGTVCAYDLSKGEFYDGGRKVLLKKVKEQVTQINIKANHVSIATTDGNIYSYNISAGVSQSILPPEEKEKISITELKAGGVTAMSMDDQNAEGMVGTTHGCIFFVIIKENKEKTNSKA